jgi:hypothetical protein
MATKKTAPKKMGRPANKYIAVTVYLAFEPDTKLKDMMSVGSYFGNEAGSIDTGSGASGSVDATVSKVTVKKSDGPYPKKTAKAPAKKSAAKAAISATRTGTKKPAAKKTRKKG